jgi:hypothetical protein
MSNVCRTLVVAEEPEVVEVVSKALPASKFDLRFVHAVEDVDQFEEAVDLLVVDSEFLEDRKIEAMKRRLPTVVVDSGFAHFPPNEFVACGEESDLKKESKKVRIAAERLLRKIYFNWIVDALEYSR